MPHYCRLEFRGETNIGELLSIEPPLYHSVLPDHHNLQMIQPRPDNDGWLNAKRFLVTEGKASCTVPGSSTEDMN